MREPEFSRVDSCGQNSTSQCFELSIPRNQAWRSVNYAQIYFDDRITLQAKVVLKKDVLVSSDLEHRQQKSHLDTTEKIYGIKRIPFNKN